MGPWPLDPWELATVGRVVRATDGALVARWEGGDAAALDLVDEAIRDALTTLYYPWC